jgi:hypothetical protein
MATTVYLSNPALTINAVDLTDQATSAVLTFTQEQLETTAFGDIARKYGAATVTSLQNNTFEVTLYQSYAATETEATIYGLVGIQCNYRSFAISCRLSNAKRDRTKIYAYRRLFESHTPINASLANYQLTLNLLAALVKAVA